ncbi:MAG: hypothetical protein WC376_00935 [Candidatus Nanoarchaeia archaeon]|jgi:hypothetical protein
MSQVNKVIQVSCPECKKEYHINLNKIKIPSNWGAGQSLYFYKTCEDENCKAPFKFYFDRITDLTDIGSPTNDPISNKGLNPINLDYLNELGGSESSEDKINSTVYRPVDADAFVKDKKLVNAKNKRYEFNYRGRIGVFYADDASVTFVSQSEQNDESLEKILLAKEHIAYGIVAKKQKQLIKKRIPIIKPVDIAFNYVDSKENTEKFNKHLENHRKNYQLAEASEILDEKRDNLDAVKNSLKKSFKNMPKTLARKAAFASLAYLIPGAGIGLSIYSIIKIGKSINNFRNLGSQYEAQLSEKNGEINGRDLEEYEDNKDDAKANLDSAVSSENALYAQIAPGSSGNNNLKALDGFLLSQDYSAIDVDHDGLTDYYVDNITHEIVENPFSVISEDSVPSNGPATYEDMQQSWNDLQEYEDARSSRLSLENIFNNINAEYTELVGLYSDADALGAKISENFKEMVSSENLSNMWMGIAVSIGISTAIATLLGVYYYNKMKKIEHGSSLLPLNSAQSSQLYKNNIVVNPIVLEEKSIDASLESIKYNEAVISKYASKVDELKKYASDDSTPLSFKFTELENSIKNLGELKTKMSEKNKYLSDQTPYSPFYELLITNLKKELDNEVTVKTLDTLLNKGLGLLKLEDIPWDKWGKSKDEYLPEIMKLTKEWLSAKNEKEDLQIAYDLEVTNKSMIIENKLKELTENIQKSASENNDLNIKNKGLNNEMFDQLELNPEILLSYNYDGFAKKYNAKLKNIIDSNQNNLDKARKAIRRMRYKILV